MISGYEMMISEIACHPPINHPISPIITITIITTITTITITITIMIMIIIIIICFFFLSLSRCEAAPTTQDPPLIVDPRPVKPRMSSAAAHQIHDRLGPV
jgi:hypothetical protein